MGKCRVFILFDALGNSVAALIALQPFRTVLQDKVAITFASKISKKSIQPNTFLIGVMHEDLRYNPAYKLLIY